MSLGLMSTLVRKMNRLKHKFNAKQTIRDNIKFSSKKEAFYYEQLKLDQAAGKVVFFLRQVPFHLPGGIKYFVDFQVFYADGTIEFVDVKGLITPLCRTKIKQVQELYPVEIVLV